MLKTAKQWRLDGFYVLKNELPYDMDEHGTYLYASYQVREQEMYVDECEDLEDTEL